MKKKLKLTKKTLKNLKLKLKEISVSPFVAHDPSNGSSC